MDIALISDCLRGLNVLSFQYDISLSCRSNVTLIREGKSYSFPRNLQSRFGSTGHVLCRDGHEEVARESRPQLPAERDIVIIRFGISFRMMHRFWHKR